MLCCLYSHLRTEKDFLSKSPNRSKHVCIRTEESLWFVKMRCETRRETEKKAKLVHPPNKDTKLLLLFLKNPVKIVTKKTSLTDENSKKSFRMSALLENGWAQIRDSFTAGNNFLHTNKKPFQGGEKFDPGQVDISREVSVSAGVRVQICLFDQNNRVTITYIVLRREAEWRRKTWGEERRTGAEINRKKGRYLSNERQKKGC